MKKLLTLTILALGLLIPSAAFADVTVDSNLTNNATINLNNASVFYAQSFVVTTTYNLTGAVFKLNSGLGSTGSAEAYLYAQTGTPGTNAAPTGSPLATSDAFDTSVIGTTGADFTFTFSGANQYLMTPGNYEIIIGFPGRTSAVVTFAVDSTKPYGNMSQTTNAGTTWPTTINDSMYFKVLGLAPIPPSTHAKVILRKKIILLPAAVSVATTTFLTTTGINTFIVPSDWNSANNTIEVIGAGGGGGSNNSGGGSGGGGGGYAKISNLSLIAGASISYTIGTGGVGTNSNNVAGTAGGSTFFNGASLGASSLGSTGGGGGPISSGTGSAGTGSGSGATTFSGGTGADASGNGGGGGGGAAGLNGAGVAGTDSGGSGGGHGGQGDNSSGGTGGTAGNAGNPGTEYDGSHGSGGGGGGGSQGGPDANAGGAYGAGGGGSGIGRGSGSSTGGQGIIVITYTPVGHGASKMILK